MGNPVLFPGKVIELINEFHHKIPIDGIALHIFKIDVGDGSCNSAVLIEDIKDRQA